MHFIPLISWTLLHYYIFIELLYYSLSEASLYILFVRIQQCITRLTRRWSNKDQQDKFEDCKKQPDGNNRRQVGHLNEIIVVPCEGRKWHRRCTPERVSTARITKHLETVPKGFPGERDQSCTDVTAGQ